MIVSVPLLLYVSGHALYFIIFPQEPHRSLSVILLSADILGYSIVCIGIFLSIRDIRTGTGNLFAFETVVGLIVVAIFITMNLLGVIATRRAYFRFKDSDCCPECQYYLIEGRDVGCPECGWNRPEGEGIEEVGGRYDT